jgi:preprotein translocase subunit YajC
MSEMSSLQLMMQLVVLSAVALGIVYFIFYRPTVDAQRKAQRVIADLAIGDEVVTAGGLIGRVVAVAEPDDGPAIVSLDLGGAVVRCRVSAIGERLHRSDSSQRGDSAGRAPAAHEGGSVQSHAQ